MADDMRIKVLTEFEEVSAMNTKLQAKLKELIGKNILNLKLDLDGMSIKDIISQAETSQKRIQKIFANPVEINANLNSVAFSDIEKRVQTIRDSVDKLASYDIKTNANGKIQSAIITYKNEAGKVTKEFMNWHTHLDKANNTLKKVFSTTKFSFSDNVEKTDKALERTISTLDKYKVQIDKIRNAYSGANFGINDESNINAIEVQYNSLAQTISNLAQQKKILSASDQQNIEKEINNLNNLVSTLKTQEAELRRIQNLGEFKQMVDPSIFNASEEAIKQYVTQLYGADAKIKQYKTSVDSAGNSMIKMTVSTKNNKNEIQQETVVLDKSTNSLYKMSDAVKTNNTRMVSFSDRLRNAWIAVSSFASVTTVFYTAVHKIKEAIELVSEINKLQSDIQMITDMTSESVQQLTKDFSNMASELHTTTNEMMSAGAEFLRAGNSIQETKNLLKATTIGAAISGQDAKTVAQQLIAISNGYKMNTADITQMMNVIDQLSYADNKSASSMEEISTALTYTSASAQSVSVSLSDLISYITTVSSVSRKSAESIGNSFKTIFARYENVKLGKVLDDETGESLSDVESILNKVGIAIRTDEKTFRSFSDVIDELGKKWKSMDDVSKSAVTSALAGTRQRENLKILLDNLGQVKDLQQQMVESAGSAEKKFNEVYANSIAARKADLAQAGQQVAMNLVQSKTISNVLVAITGLVNGFNTLITAGTGAKITLGLLTVALILCLKHFKMTILEIATAPAKVSVLRTAIALLTGSVSGLARAWEALRTGFETLFFTPQGWAILAIVTAIGSAIAATTMYIKHQKALREETERLTDSYKNLTQAMEENNTASMKTEQDNLKKQQTSLQKLLEERIKLQEGLKNTSNDIYGEYGLGTDAMSTRLEEVNTKIREQISVLEDAGYTVNSLTGEIQELSKVEGLLEANNVAESISKQAEAEMKQRDAIVSLANEYNYLLGIANKTAEQQARMSQISNELSGKMYGLVTATDEHGNVLIQNVDYMNDSIKAMSAEGDSISSLTNFKLECAKQQQQVQIGLTKMTYAQAKERIRIDQQELAAYSAIIEAKMAKGAINEIEAEKLIWQRTKLVQRYANEVNAALSQMDKIYSGGVNYIGGSTTSYTPSSSLGSSSSSSSSSSKEISQIEVKIDRYQTLNDVLSELEGKIALLETAEDSLNGKAKVDAIEEKIKLYEKQKEAYKNLYNEQLKEQQELKGTLSNAGFGFDSEGYVTNMQHLQAMANAANSIQNESSREAAQDRVKDLEDMLSRYNELTHKTLLDTKKDWEGITNEIADATKEMKDLYQEQLDVVSEVEDKIKDMMRQSLDDKKDALDEELEDYQDMINGKLDALEEYYDKEEYEKNLAKQQASIQEIQNKINQASLDDSREGQAKLAELQKELAKLQEELTETQYEREKELRRKNLEDALATKEEEINAQKEALDKLWSDEQISIRARQALLDGQFEDAMGNIHSITDAYIEFENRFGDGLSTLGDRIKTEFVDKIKEALLTVKDMDAIIRALNRLENGGSSGTGGSYAEGGLIDYTGTAKVHGTSSKPEMVLNNTQAAKLFSFIKGLDWIPNIGNIISSVRAVEPRTGQPISLGSLITVNGNVDRTVMPDLKQLAQEIKEELGRGIKIAGLSR